MFTIKIYNLLEYYTVICSYYIQDGIDILLGFSNQLGGAFKNAYQENYDDEVVRLTRDCAEGYFKDTSKFSGSFVKACQ